MSSDVENMVDNIQALNVSLIFTTKFVFDKYWKVPDILLLLAVKNATCWASMSTIAVINALTDKY